MKIVVAMKQVLDPRGFTVNRKADKIFVNREEWITNPADLCALEAALALKDKFSAEVVVLSGGPARAGDALRDAWARGADRTIHLSDKAFSTADGCVAARILAKAIDKLGAVDLIVCGDRALDTGAGEVGPRLAEALGWPQVLGALDVSVQDGHARAVKADGAGCVELLVGMPALVTLAAGANHPRYPHGGRIMESYQQYQPEAWTAADLGLSEDELKPLVDQRGQSFPPERQRGTILDSPEELVRLLKRNRVI